MEYLSCRIFSYIISILGIISLFALPGCGNSEPDRVEVSPVEKTLEIGDSYQFTATAWAKDKKLSNMHFEWQVEGDAGAVDNSGRFTAQKPGQAVIIARIGDLEGKSGLLVKSKQAVEVAPASEKNIAAVKPDLSGLKKVIILDSQDGKRGPVSFSHLKHAGEYEVSCTECHHEYKDGKNIWTQNDPVKKCGECHDPEEKKDGVMKLQNAFHKNCRDCHKQMAEESTSEIAPYKKCTDCHQG